MEMNSVHINYLHGIRPNADYLDPPERLIVGGVRLWLETPANWPLVAEDFRLAFGDDESLFALNGFKGLLELLARDARRTLYFHKPRCTRVSTDERTLLTLLATLQHGRHEHAQAVLRWLLPAPQQGAAYIHAFWLACGMAECGLMLRPPVENEGIWC